MLNIKIHSSNLPETIHQSLVRRITSPGRQLSPSLFKVKFFIPLRNKTFVMIFHTLAANSKQKSICDTQSSSFSRLFSQKILKCKTTYRFSFRADCNNSRLNATFLSSSFHSNHSGRHGD